MADPVEIPVDPKIPDQSFWVNLDGERYYMKFYWNTRDEQWYFSILQTPDDSIKTCVPILPGWSPFRQFTDDRLPPGNFVVVDSSGKDVLPTRYEFGLGQRVRLLYYG